MTKHSLSNVWQLSSESTDTPRLVVLDGGMGTTLQAPPFNLALDSALWSSELLATDAGRHQLANLHHTWIQAGADWVQTCTYQSTLPLFLPAADSAPSPETISTALETMTAALPVAAKACQSSTSTSSGRSKPRVALSLGPYGSALQPGQEYTGAYPPPFGPAQTAAANKARPACSAKAREVCPLPLEQVRASYPPTGTNGEEEDDEDREAEEVHLAAWHLQRLQHFLLSRGQDQDQDDQDSQNVDVLAFETVPSLTEIRAIRKAMHIFTTTTTSSSGNPLPFYISLVFPRTSDSDDAVRFPDPELAHLPNLADQIPLLVEAALLDSNTGYAVPGGLGFNCTSPLHAQQVVRLLSDQVAKLQQQQQQQQQEEKESDNDDDKPWLLVYPDGGAVYDVVSRSWHHPTGLTDSSWARLVADAVKDAVPAPAPASASPSPSPWAGVVVGGCCKAGPSAIKALRQEVEQRGWR